MESSGPVQGWIFPLSTSHVLAESTTLCATIIFVFKTTLFLDVTSGRWVPNKCWCLSSKLCGVTPQNIMLFSPFLTMPLQHHMWKQGKFMVQFLDEVTETTHSSQQHSKQCKMCWWSFQSSGMWLWCWGSSWWHFQQFYCLHCQAQAVYTYEYNL